MAADHLFELDADLLGIAGVLEGHLDNVSAALRGGFVVCNGAVPHRFEPPMGLEAVLVVPHAAVRTHEARAALPDAVPLVDALFNVAHASMLTLGLATSDWELISAGLEDRLHQPRRAHLYPRSIELLERARSLGALGATISGAGPTVLVWCRYEQTGALVEALRRETEGWATVMRARFEPQGADVRSL
jgi:homoserine kinase